jgi:hypothetical protein
MREEFLFGVKGKNGKKELVIFPGLKVRGTLIAAREATPRNMTDMTKHPLSLNIPSR